MRTAIGAMIALLVWTGAAWAGEHPKADAKPAQALDGKVFDGELGKAGEPSGDKDKLVFKKGKFVSTACVAHGFHDAPYTAAEKDGTVAFTSSASNSSAETMNWTGTVRDGIVEATAVHKAASGETTYWFKGKLGAAEASSKSKDHPKKSEHPEHPK